jgi:hypothetical protein
MAVTMLPERVIEVIVYEVGNAKVAVCWVYDDKLPDTNRCVPAETVTATAPPAGAAAVIVDVFEVGAVFNTFSRKLL